MRRIAQGLTLVLLLAGAAAAADFHQHLRQAGKAYDAQRENLSLQHLQQAIALVWDQLPFGVRQARLLADMPNEQGGYHPRPDSTYQSGELLLLYLEPIGFKVRQEGDVYLYNLEADFTLQDAWGHMVGSQKRFSALQGPSLSFPDRLSVVISYNLVGLTAGDYRLQTRVRDVLGGKEHTVTNLIHIVSPGQQ